MTSENLSAACHCGSVVFTVQLSDGFHTARRCNCSFCRMRGAVTVSAPLSGIKVVKGQDKLTEYRFNTGKAVHFFCSVCGIYTFHLRRSNPDQYGVNVACIENVSPFDFACVEVNDGVTHPGDGGSNGVVGYLSYEPKKTPPVETGGKNI
ncbi:GFA family protein [Salmonella enterica subsp. salamae]|uniref:Glutathione-dependent formaldehyde-activating, GFA n=3 Tax=Salmonella enterica TaxID=28901 RepID=A0A379QKK8_SALER|nr:GFA family protein [Salmonella enterica]ECC1479232.1 GFA family protein [Salmonella enterica subsp. salamae]EHM1751445.1 GFA family protein [Salmonella enterica subsp. salamae serovar 40:c:e,n,x,z15]HCM1998530.1 GFA family protein [Salmonella enterica subsp. salamae serovar [1],40:z35:e,n,x,z15]ASG88456.1 aldehyde-activating protein [Salmonella enterica subsp. salamae serovar 55:k:z39 str. 1315K]ECC1656232.1 GFA family protein [Salmonella enterica subsp. salamae]